MPIETTQGAMSPMALLALLQQVQSLRFEARSEAATGWQGVGAGTVEVSEPAPGVLVFVEAGSWQPEKPGQSALKFSNVYRWSAGDNVVRLEHLRFGLAAPVLLFDMAPTLGGEWREVCPHHCGEDRYRAALAIKPGEIVLAWSIVGPEKSESIRYTYR